MHRDIFFRILLIIGVAGTLLAKPTASNAQAPGLTDLPALVVLVRHADTAPDSGSNPPLTAAGAKRAQDLAATLRDTKFSAVITTQLIRTRDTAQPLVALLGLTPEVVNLNPAEREAHIKAMEASVRKHVGGSLLVVGHSGTVPGIIATLGGPRLPDICETVFDDLFMLVSVAGRVQFVHARYGAPSPTPGPDCK